MDDKSHGGSIAWLIMGLVYMVPPTWICIWETETDAEMCVTQIGGQTEKQNQDVWHAASVLTNASSTEEFKQLAKSNS